MNCQQLFGQFISTVWNLALPLIHFWSSKFSSQINAINPNFHFKILYFIPKNRNLKTTIFGENHIRIEFKNIFWKFDKKMYKTLVNMSDKSIDKIIFHYYRRHNTDYKNKFLQIQKRKSSDWPSFWTNLDLENNLKSYD